MIREYLRLGRKFLCSLRIKLSMVVNLRLDKSGRAVPARKFKWTGPGRSGPNFSWAGPFFANIPQRFCQYSAIFLNEQGLI